MIEKSMFGREFRFSIKGASHAPWIELKLFGLSPAESHALDLNRISDQLRRRSPAGLDGLAAGKGATARRETDDFSMDFKNPLTLLIFNKDQKSKDYEGQKTLPRPGHADLGIYYQEKRLNPDLTFSLPPAGGSHSGRMTAAMVAAGAIASQVLEMRGIFLDIESKLVQVGGIELDHGIEDQKLGPLLEEANQAGDSLGGLVEFTIRGLPPGLGGPMNEGIESVIAPLLLAIPGVKCLDFGSGMGAASLRGSQNNDEIVLDPDGQPTTRTNKCGGILGGISTGRDITGRLAFKPTPSIEKDQTTVDLADMTETRISTKGRHDSCIALRGRVVVEALLACVALDLVMMQEARPRPEESLDSLRRRIDSVDSKLAQLLSERFAISDQVGQIKKDRGLAVLNKDREKQILTSFEDMDFSGSIAQVYLKIFEESKALQKIEAPSQDSKDSDLASGQEAKKGDFALLGRPISHSYSPQIFDRLGYTYDLLDLDQEGFYEAIKNQEYQGFNVTSPYKKLAAQACQELTEIAEEIGAVNTLFKKSENSKKDNTGPDQADSYTDDTGKTGYIGDNTDYQGMLDMIGQGKLKGKKVLILGKGGAAATARVLASHQGAASIMIKGREDLTADQAQADIVINCTPVGTSPNFDQSPLDLTQLKNCQAVFDLVYNPHKTALAMQAQDLGLEWKTGLTMLIGQALAACQRFTGQEIQDKKELAGQIEDEIIKQTQHIVFIGMPGSGKSQAGKKTADLLGRAFYDLDQEIVQSEDQSAQDIILDRGEETFRIIEEDVACRLFERLARQRQAAVISFGGGTVLSEKVMKIARQTACIVFLDRPLDQLSTQGRPLSQDGQALVDLYEKRISLYNGYYNIKINVSEDASHTAQRTIEKWRQI